jgi:hypothetical protein
MTTAPAPGNDGRILFDLADYIRSGNIPIVVSTLACHLFLPSAENPCSIGPKIETPEIDRWDQEGHILLTVAARAQKHALLSFVALLEKGANPRARGMDGRVVEDDLGITGRRRGGHFGKNWKEDRGHIACARSIRCVSCFRSLPSSFALTLITLFKLPLPAPAFKAEIQKLQETSQAESVTNPASLPEAIIRERFPQ